MPAREYCGCQLKGDPKQIALARRFLQANRTDGPQRPYPLYALVALVQYWAAEHISRDAVRVALKLEGCAVTVELSAGFLGGVLYCWLTLAPGIHAMLSAYAQGAIDHVDGALAALAASPSD
jgi:hypothetical protein